MRRESGLKYSLVLLALVACSLHCAAQQSAEQDTVYFYDSWQKIFDLAPDTMIVNPVIDVYSPFEIYVKADDKKVNKKIKKEYIAATLGDTTWVVNSNYLRKKFKGDSKRLHGFVPLFYNDKVAYAIGEEYTSMGLADIDFTVISNDYFYIDFKQRRVRCVDHKVLSDLLVDYPDLKMRYEGMKDYKKMPIVKDFFLQFLDRTSDDPSWPDILDAVRDMEKTH